MTGGYTGWNFDLRIPPSTRLSHSRNRPSIFEDQTQCFLGHRDGEVDNVDDRLVQTLQHILSLHKSLPEDCGVETTKWRRNLCSCPGEQTNHPRNQKTVVLLRRKGKDVFDLTWWSCLPEVDDTWQVRTFSCKRILMLMWNNQHFSVTECLERSLVEPEG